MSHPFWVLFAVACLMAVVYVLGRALGRARVAKELHCPVRDQDYTVEFECELDAEWGLGKRVDVVACSCFGGDAVSCQKGCVDVPLELMKARAHAHAA